MPFYTLPLFQKHLTQPGRVLGVDWGRRRIGIAVSDALGLLAHPLETLVRSNFQNDLHAIRRHLVAYEIQGIVVGLPIGTETQTKSSTVRSIQSWTHRLCSCIAIPVTFFDEDFSSQEVTELYATKTGHRTHVQDHDAAAIILQRFLDRC